MIGRKYEIVRIARKPLKLDEVQSISNMRVGCCIRGDLIGAPQKVSIEKGLVPFA